MKIQYVRGEMITTEIHHGTVTQLSGKCGIVLFDDGRSAYFNIIDGCHVGLGESDYSKGLKFTLAVDIVRPKPDGHITEKRIVCYFARNPDWAYVWAYETEWNQACAQLRQWQKARQAEQDERDRQEKQRIAEQQRKDDMKRKNRDALVALGNFRISQAHKFDQEREPRPSKPATGPMKIADLLLAIGHGTVKFSRFTRKGGNDTLLMWFEYDCNGKWVKTDITADEAVLLTEAYDGEVGLEKIQPIIDRISGRLPSLVA